MASYLYNQDFILSCNHLGVILRATFANILVNILAIILAWFFAIIIQIIILVLQPEITLNCITKLFILGVTQRP